jgi:hypothetical protein
MPEKSTAICMMSMDTSVAGPGPGMALHHSMELKVANSVYRNTRNT